MPAYRMRSRSARVRPSAPKSSSSIWTATPRSVARTSASINLEVTVPDSNRYISTSTYRRAASMVASRRGRKRRPSISSSKRLPSRQGKRNVWLLSGIRRNISYLVLFRRCLLRYRRRSLAEPAYVFDATADNFRTLVLANSDKGPVVVNFWSPRAGPCLMLMPRLLKLAEEFRGRFLLVRLNTDTFARLARDQGVTSIPTTKVFRHGAVVDTLQGAESEASLRAFLRKHLGGPTGELRTAALRAFESGDAERAASLAAQAAPAEPDDPRIPLDVAKLLVLQGRYAQAEALLEALPATLREQEPV